MANILKTGAQWLSDMRIKHISETVTYSRGVITVQVLGTRGVTKFEVADESGMSVYGQIADWIILTADLVLGGILIEPKKGDRIIAQDKTFEVVFLSGDGCWRYSDPHQITMRIHTKEISA
ncbi:MAG: hypothetical protein UV78_C0006G0023 [Parcubacteria group bacterium GW2011_GWA2_43_17]|nr:MAG: hypothetical protein UV78_C0006G0023 [Parcubacteria group bacterium GW2011_GWA2_43_17]OHB43447.1 MAG: hypothetical protein A2Y13_03980 [Planctomycetes bacterium GWC2_45_44]HBR20296.1 hypothetical protein [Phycisphaerales bacterium]